MLHQQRPSISPFCFMGKPQSLVLERCRLVVRLTLKFGSMKWLPAADNSACVEHTSHDGDLAEQALRDARDQHHALQAGLHLTHQRLVLLVFGHVVHQGAALALPAKRGRRCCESGEPGVSKHCISLAARYEQTSVAWYRLRRQAVQPQNITWNHGI